MKTHDQYLFDRYVRGHIDALYKVQLNPQELYGKSYRGFIKVLVQISGYLESIIDRINDESGNMGYTNERIAAPSASVTGLRLYDYIRVMTNSKQVSYVEFRNDDSGNIMVQPSRAERLPIKNTNLNDILSARDDLIEGVRQFVVSKESLLGWLVNLQRCYRLTSYTIKQHTDDTVHITIEADSIDIRLYRATTGEHRGDLTVFSSIMTGGDINSMTVPHVIKEVNRFSYAMFRDCLNFATPGLLDQTNGLFYRLVSMYDVDAVRLYFGQSDNGVLCARRTDTGWLFGDTYDSLLYTEENNIVVSNSELLWFIEKMVFDLCETLVIKPFEDNWVLVND